VEGKKSKKLSDEEDIILKIRRLKRNKSSKAKSDKTANDLYEALDKAGVIDEEHQGLFYDLNYSRASKKESRKINRFSTLLFGFIVISVGTLYYMGVYKDSIVPKNVLEDYERMITRVDTELNYVKHGSIVYPIKGDFTVAEIKVDSLAPVSPERRLSQPLADITESFFFVVLLQIHSNKGSSSKYSDYSYNDGNQDSAEND
jgi:amino acid permease